MKFYSDIRKANNLSLIDQQYFGFVDETVHKTTTAAVVSEVAVKTKSAVSVQVIEESDVPLLRQFCKV